MLCEQLFFSSSFQDAPDAFGVVVPRAVQLHTSNRANYDLMMDLF